MTRRAARLAVAVAAALAALPARAQWRPQPIVVPLEGPGLDVVPGAFGAAGQDDLLVVDQPRRTATLRPHHAPLAPAPSVFPAPGLPVTERAFRAGDLAPNGMDGLADVASHRATSSVSSPASELEVVFGHDPSSVHTFSLLPFRTDTGGPAAFGPPYVVSFLRLLARTPRADSLVMPYCLDDVCSRLFLVDPVSAASAAVTSVAAPDLDPMDTQPEAFPVWLSTTARALAVDDVAVGSFGTVVLWGQESAAPTLAALGLSDPVVVGTTRHLGVPRPTWLPQTFDATPSGFNEVHGVASLDVDKDGLPDLVFTLANPSFPTVRGKLAWVRSTGVLADFADPLRATWHDLGAQLGLPDPVLVRSLGSAGGGSPAVAIWDRLLQQVVVLTPVPVQDFTVWTAPAPGATAVDVRLADVVGSAAPDLVVVMANGAQPDTVLVYPDAGSSAPRLAWAAGSPGAAVRGLPHEAAVLLDPGGAASVLVEWIAGASTSAPVGTGLSHVFPATCAPSPAPIPVTVRASDGTGITTELAGLLTFTGLAPTLSLAGSPAPRLALPPGGTAAVFDAVVATSCGDASFGGTAWPALATVTDLAGPASLRRTVALPEAAYPDLLAEPARVVSVATIDPGAVPSTAALAVALDATGLVELRQEADRSVLAAGDLAVVRTRLRSRLGVALPAVRVVAVLSGLRAAGVPTVTGAVPVSAAADGAEVVLAALPPGAEVVVELPVRALGGPASAGAEARASGGWLVTAPAREARLQAGPPPGCGCASGSAPGTLALAGLVLLARRRRPRAT